MIKQKFSKALIAATVFAVAAFAGHATASNNKTTQFVTIGTGGVTGVYYPTGGSICRLVNKNRKETGIRCSVESTGGSVFNINALRTGDLDMGIAQSDWQYHAYHGSSRFKDQGPFKDLRFVFSIHAEPATLVARADSGIKGVMDIKGKRVNIGEPGSGAAATFDVMAEALGIERSDLKLVSELKSSEVGSALCDNKIDAFFFTVGHPSGLLKQVTTTCDAKIIPVTGKGITKLIDERSYYSKAKVAGGMYDGNPYDVPTFGVGATFLSSAKVSDDVIYEVVRAVFENFEAFKKLHPAFRHLEKSEMISAGMSAPLHDGAARFYREQGWIE